MKTWSKRRVVGILILIVACVFIASALRQTQRLPLTPAGRGIFCGHIPQLGDVQLSLRSTNDWPHAWLYVEGQGEPQRLFFHQSADGRFDAVSHVGWVETNGFMKFHLEVEGRVLRGDYRGVMDTQPVPFTLRREYTEFTLNRTNHLNFVISKVESDFSGTFVGIPNDNAFLTAVSNRVHLEISEHAIKETHTKLEDLRYPGRMWWVRSEWQPRLLSSSAASFAILSDHDGNGYTMEWSGRTYIWRDDQLIELKLADLFIPGRDWLVALKKSAADSLELEDQMEIADGIRDGSISLNSFTVSSTGIQLYYLRPHDIAPDAFLYISFEELRPYLEPQIIARFSPSEPAHR